MRREILADVEYYKWAISHVVLSEIASQNHQSNLWQNRSMVTSRDDSYNREKEILAKSKT
ncbi:hypothetical protein PP707_04820 [Acetobacter pasteurianus]|nr:hypothetical protein [Acetobacter pasteurianus]